MYFPLFVARRYLFSKKSSNAINVITWVAMLGIAVGTAALLIVLSVFNGLSGLITGLFGAIDADLKAVPVRGKTFIFDEVTYQKLLHHPEVAAVSQVLDGKVGLQYRNRQAFATLRGVDTNFTKVAPIDSSAYMYEGKFTLTPPSEDGIGLGVFGSVMQQSLTASLRDYVHPIDVLAPSDKVSLLNPSGAIRSRRLFPSGFFSAQKEYDASFVFVSLAFARDLFDAPEALSSYEIRLKHPENAEKVKAELAAIWGGDMRLLTRYEQHDTLYRVMRNEKFVSYLLLVLMLALSGVNIIGSLVMIVIEKTRDIAILKAAGATPELIRTTFLWEGLLVSGIGGGVGMGLALLFCLLQQQFGFLKLSGGDSFVVDAFPVAIQVSDFVLIFFTVMALALAAAWYPAQRASRIAVVDGLKY